MLHSVLSKIKDHRRRQGQRYALGQILFLAILALLSGATSYRKIHAFIKTHSETLTQLFNLNWKRVPAHTTIWAIIRATPPTELEACFRDYSAQLVENDPPERFLSVDGKVLRGSFDHFKDQKAIQVLSAFLTDSRIILAHEEIAEKTNEIPMAQELMTQLGLSGYIFTFHALHCQEKTLTIAHETSNEVIVQVKENQPTLLRDCQVTAATQCPTEVYQEPMTKTHGRLESRRVEVFTPPPLTDPAKWASVQAIVKVERYRRIFDTPAKQWNPSDETSCYIATTVLSAEAFGVGIRGHWGIENRDHHVRDVTLGEDQSRIRTNPDIFGKLRSFALNILRANQVANVSLELFNNCMNLNRVLNYVGVT